MAVISTNPTSNTVVVTGWTNPTYAYNEDGVQLATATPPKAGYVTSDFGGFDFSTLPANAVINSVAVWISAKSSGASGTALQVLWQPWSGGAAVGTEQVQSSLATSLTAYSQTWTLTAAQLKAADFKVRLRSYRSGNTSYTCSVDYIRVTVDYSLLPLSLQAQTSGVAGVAAPMVRIIRTITGVAAGSSIVGPPVVRITRTLAGVAAGAGTAAASAVTRVVSLGLAAAGGAAVVSAVALRPVRGLGGTVVAVSTVPLAVVGVARGLAASVTGMGAVSSPLRALRTLVAAAAGSAGAGAAVRPVRGLVAGVAAGVDLTVRLGRLVALRGQAVALGSVAGTVSRTISLAADVAALGEVLADITSRMARVGRTRAAATAAPLPRPVATLSVVPSPVGTVSIALTPDVTPPVTRVP